MKERNDGSGMSQFCDRQVSFVWNSIYYSACTIRTIARRVLTSALGSQIDQMRKTSERPSATFGLIANGIPERN